MNIKKKRFLTGFVTCCFCMTAWVYVGGCSAVGSVNESEEGDIRDSGVGFSDGGDQDQRDAHQWTDLDSGDSTTPCEEGDTQPCYPGDPEHAGVGICVMGTQVCERVMDGEFSTTQWGPCEGAGEPREEECNGLDDNCNGETDDGAECPENEICSDGACVQLYQDCSLTGYGMLAHGQEVSSYLTATVPCGHSCSLVTISCNDGTLSGGSSYFESCSVESCTCKFIHGKGYSHLDPGTSCSSELLNVNTTSGCTGGVQHYPSYSCTYSCSTNGVLTRSYGGPCEIGNGLCGGSVSSASPTTCPDF